MIRGAGIAGAHRAPSVRRFLLTSCAVLVGAGIMLLASPVGGPGSARAQFNFGGFHIPIGARGGWRRGRHSSRSARRHRRHRNDDDTPDPDAGGGSSSTSAATPAPENTGRATVRPAAATEPRASSGRPAPRGPDLEPSK